MMEQVCPVVAGVSRPMDASGKEFLWGIASAVLRRAGDGPREVRAAGASVTVGNAYSWIGLLRAVQRARMSSLESAIWACIQEING